jgi:flagellar basal-body rod modification protein FlgD
MEVSAVGTQGFTTSVESESKIDKEFFLQLLVTQMKYQNPLSPMEDNEFISQTSQFSMLEEIQSLKDEVARLSVYNLIGKQVQAEKNNQIIEGVVDAVSIQGDKLKLSVDEYSLDVADIIEVRHE